MVLLGYIRRDDVREMMMNSQSMKPITVTPNKRPVQLGPYENEQQVNELKKTLMDNGFKISQGAIGYDSTTRKAEQRYNLLKKHDYTPAQILYVARQEQAPYHLLLDGNKELFDKWFEPTSFKWKNMDKYILMHLLTQKCCVKKHNQKI